MVSRIKDGLTFIFKPFFVLLQNTTMFRFTVLACLLVLAVGAPFDQGLNNDWQLFKSVHEKEYESWGEEQFRRGVWEKNLDIIKRHNLEASLGVHTYTLGMNKYGDLVRRTLIDQRNIFRN